MPPVGELAHSRLRFAVTVRSPERTSHAYATTTTWIRAREVSRRTRRERTRARASLQRRGRRGCPMTSVVSDSIESIRKVVLPHERFRGWAANESSSFRRRRAECRRRRRSRSLPTFDPQMKRRSRDQRSDFDLPSSPSTPRASACSPRKHPARSAQARPLLQRGCTTSVHNRGWHQSAPRRASSTTHATSAGE